MDAELLHPNDEYYEEIYCDLGRFKRAMFIAGALHQSKKMYSEYNDTTSKEMKFDKRIYQFMIWLELNCKAESPTGLKQHHGYEWVEYMWGIWLANSDAGKEITQQGLIIIK